LHEKAYDFQHQYLIMNTSSLLQVTSSPLSTVGKRFRWQAVGFFAIPVVGAFLAGRGVPLPLPGCALRHLTGIPCPACGMTRSFIAFAKGDFATSVHQHLFGPLLFVACLLVFLHICSELRFGYKIQGWHTQLLKKRGFVWGFGVIFLGYYCLRLYQMSQTGELWLAVQSSPLSSFLH
jgi:Protein of unknown function (DUF2752)